MLTGVEFKTEPPNPFFTLEGGNSSLEWMYTFGDESFRQAIFGNVKTLRIVELSSSDKAPWIKTSYIGRLIVKISNNYTLITLLGVKRTDSGIYHLELTANPSRESKTSKVEISVHCEYTTKESRLLD